jgi:transcription-repair coupling factor (superfamily II helicase)
MRLSDLAPNFAAEPTLAAALAEAEGSDEPLTVELRDSLKSIFVALLVERIRRPLIVITPEEARASELAHDISMWVADIPVMHFPDTDQPAYSMLAINHGLLAQRVAVMEQLVRAQMGSPLVVVASAPALMRRLMPIHEFRGNYLTLAPGTVTNLDSLTRRLVRLGYRATPLVERPGEFAHRGGIVDVFPPSASLPVRVDFYGDEIESVRSFDPTSQRSTRPAPDLIITPATEVPIWLGSRVAGRLRSLELAQLRPEDRQTWTRHLEQLEGGEYFDDAAFYTTSLLPDAVSLLDYAAEAKWLAEELEQTRLAASDAERTAEENRERLAANGELPTNFASPLFPAADFITRIERATVRLTYVPSLPGAAEGGRSVTEGFDAVPSYAGRLRRLTDDLTALRRDGRNILITSHQGRRLQHLLLDQGLSTTTLKDLDSWDANGSITILNGTLSEGIRHDDLGITLITDAEVFGRRPMRRRGPSHRGADRTFLSDLQPGDFVVHVDHGLARFSQIVQLQDTGGAREYLLLEYQGDDRLYVPVDQVGRVQKFVGMTDAEPKLSRLNTADWQRAKSRARKSAESMAHELLEIYAARELASGQAFGPDSSAQRVFEEAFEFIETPDQLAAIADTKVDMERERPMDRLVAGDVGYGKTEVALRAAFKAAMGGRQVAVLVPTTILAQQHFDTFSSRLREYPVKVELLSRFRTRPEQTDVLDRLAAGDVDIVIGTHRLLQPDVTFADLGLIVVDEEQRFGVTHKEKLKGLRTNVDVLTLTATPIPRTLHMALASLREISVIESPPEQRLAVKTYVTTYDDDIVRNAIQSEIARDGQVYFLHNRVQTILTWQQRLQALLPEVELLVAHGQMPPAELEEVMYRFARGEAQVLLATAIIENGLDIPNVNTIIVNDAWRFGLAQLYQLRGRVGRAATQAYAYFLYRRSHKLTVQAKKRLQTILEASDLGAGFRIAMRDLEIRGAGNLLGAEQHGHMSAVGFDLYSRMLAEAVEKLRGEEPEPEVPAAVVDLPLDAYLSDEYMGSYASKIREYQRLAHLRGIDEVENAIADIRDRFGDPPASVENLAYLLRIKARAQTLGFPAVTTYGKELIIKTPPDFAPSPTVMLKATGWGIKRGKAGLVWNNFSRDSEWESKLMLFLDDLVRWNALAPTTS